MKIVTKKQMRLDELIKYVWEDGKGIKKCFTSRRGKMIRVGNGGIDFSGVGNGVILEDDTFTVEVNEKLTEKTVFDELADLHFDKDVGKLQLAYHSNVSISEITTDTMERFTSSAVYHKDTLIWTKDAGIPTEGVLEI